MPTYELVVYGATGFTGRLAAKYVAQTYPDLKWAIAGRSEAKLQQIKAECGGKPGIIVADAQDESALAKMVGQTKAVAACAGPFRQHGSKLVAACVKAGTDYCDITGEIPWVRDMIAEHDDAARKSGARIVHLCGHDSVPWDLSTLMLSKKLKENGEELVRVDFFDDIVSQPSGGTTETAFSLLFGDKVKPGAAQKALGYDPLLKPAKGTGPSTSTVKNQSVKLNSLEFANGKRQARVNMFMSGVNMNCVKRSNALNGYSDRLVYNEGWACKSNFEAVWSVIKTFVFGLMVAFPPLRAFLRAYVLPKPGEGPSEEFMDKGHLTVLGVGKGSGGTMVRSTMHFSVDPGYKDTARMVVESALALAIDQVKCPGGVLTAAACQGEVLLDRLLATGTSFEFH